MTSKKHNLQRMILGYGNSSMEKAPERMKGGGYYPADDVDELLDTIGEGRKMRAQTLHTLSPYPKKGQFVVRYELDGEGNEINRRAVRVHYSDDHEIRTMHGKYSPSGQATYGPSMYIRNGSKQEIRGLRDADKEASRLGEEAARTRAAQEDAAEKEKIIAEIIQINKETITQYTELVSKAEHARDDEIMRLRTKVAKLQLDLWLEKRKSR